MLDQRSRLLQISAPWCKREPYLLEFRKRDTSYRFRRTCSAPCSMPRHKRRTHRLTDCCRRSELAFRSNSTSPGEQHQMAALFLFVTVSHSLFTNLYKSPETMSPNLGFNNFHACSSKDGA